MTQKPQPQGTLWVCAHCLFAREGDGLEEPCGCDTPCVPWARKNDTDVTLGAFEHSEHCTEEDREEGCDCTRIDFSWSSCDGCGCPLAGEREAYVWWA